MPSTTPKRIVLAHVASAHGIKGDVVVRAHTGAPEALADYGPLTDASGKRQFEITQLKATAKGVVVRFKGIADRTAAEALRGLELYVERSALPVPADGEYYHVDLIGLAAVSPDGATIGQVIAVQNFGAGEMLEIKRADAKETEYVPFTDTFVPTVDIEGGRVTVIIPEMVGEPEPASGEEDESGKK
jgi:16S rRNA processing protein RimM